MTQPQIFFIDDEQDLRLANEQTLQLAGFDVRLFEKAEDALPLLDRNWPGVLISDIRLPGINGGPRRRTAVRRPPNGWWKARAARWKNVASRWRIVNSKPSWVRRMRWGRASSAKPR